MKSSRQFGRTGLILAAGYGSRHAVGTKMVLKPLLPVAGRPLILRTLDGLHAAGCSRVVIVLGYEEDRIRTSISETYAGPVQVEYVVNRRFDLKNGVSVLSARDSLPETFVLSMADHVFDESAMKLVARQKCPPGGASLLVDFKIDSILDIDDATKVVVEDGRVVRIGKGLKAFNAVDCGVFLAGNSLLNALDDTFSRTGNASLSDGVQKLASAGRMQALDLGDGNWQDVDTPEMLAAAERLVGDARTRDH